MHQVVASAGFALAVLVSDFEEDTWIFVAWSSLTVNLTQNSWHLAPFSASLFTTLYCVSDVKRKHLQSAGKKRLEPDWCTRSLAQEGGGSGQLSWHTMNFTFNIIQQIQKFILKHTAYIFITVFVEIVLAPKVSPAIEMMNKWGVRWLQICRQ